MDTENLIDEITEPVLSAEEHAIQDIETADDAEQVRVHSIADHGTPMKYMVVRSEKQDKQVLIQQEYFALKEKGKPDIIGYLRKGDRKTIQPFGTENKLDLRVIGEQGRGE